MYPSIYDTASGNGKIGYDNFRFTAFPTSYCEKIGDTTDFSKIVTYHYDGTYELPYGQTEAKVGSDIYDDANEAITAAEEGQTVTLTKNAAKTLVVDKSIYLDTNIYDENGAATGSFYTFEYTSYTAMAPIETEAGSGIFKFEKKANTVNVIWDEACDGDCDCLAEYGGHQLSAITSFSLGEIPVHPSLAPVYSMAADYSQKFFMGWSYENDGTVDEIVAITEDDIASGTVKLYPVYKTRHYTVKVTSSSGTISYYDGETLAASINKFGESTTIQLFGDTITTQLNLPNKNKVTFDLNGYSLSNQTTIVNNYEATLGENGEYVKGAIINTETLSSRSGYLFYFGSLSSTYSFTLKSSRPGATIGGMTVNVDRWISNGEVVKTENATITGAASLFNFYPINGTVNMYGENITYYVATIIYAEHGGNGSEKINIDGGTFVNLGVADEGMFGLRNGEKVTFKNATFYCNGVQLIRNSSGTGNRNKNTEVTFENCKIYNAALYSNAPTDKYTFNNCIADVSITAGSACAVVIGKNTVTTKDIVASYTNASLAQGLESEAISKKLYYNKVTKDQVIFDLETLTPTDEVANNYTSSTFSYLAKGSDTKMATVTWKDADGNVLAVTEEIAGLVAFAPKVPWGDGYRGVVNAVWVDSEGNDANLVIGDADAYEFTAVLPEKENAAFEAYVTDAMLNMTYYAYFAYSFYLPVVEGVTVTSIGGKVPSSTVYIYDREYYIITAGYVNSTAALTNNTVKVCYTADGISYEASFTFNALLYAQLAIHDPKSSEIEKESVACLVRYIHESYKYVDADHVLDDATEAKFQDYYTNYRTPAPYTTEYPQKTLHTVNETAISGLIESITFTTISSRVTVAVTLTDDAVAKGYKVFFSGVGWGNESNQSGKTFYTNNRLLYRYLMADTYTISVVEADGKTTVVRDLDGDGEAETKAETNYSMATYITVMEKKGTNVDLAKALYALGVAVLEVRNTIY